MGSVRGQAMAAALLGVVFLAGAGVAAYKHFQPAPEVVIEASPEAGSGAAARIPMPSGPPPADVVVHVVGGVNSPGVYRLPAGSRVDDAIKAAGGAKPGAAVDSLNLAALLEDGAQLRILMAAETAAATVPAAVHVRASSRRADSAAIGNGRAGKLSSPGDGTVNVNTASEEELQRLPGVGPATARRIIEFRKQNGPFSAPEQLLDVSGIGQKKLEAMLPFVRVR